MRRLAVCFSSCGYYPRTALGPHASRVPPPATNEPANPTLGPHASRALPPSNNSKGAKKARKTPKTSCPAPSLPHDVACNPGTGTSVVPLFNTGQSADVRPFSLLSPAYTPGLNRAGITASAPLKNPSISAVTAEESRPGMVMQLADEMASHLIPSDCGPIGRAGKISTNSTISTISAMGPYRKKSGKNSTNSMNSMPTHMEIAGVAPARPFQFERGHSGSPNVTRPRFSNEKSGNNSANSARTATLYQRGKCRPCAGPPAGLQTCQQSTEKSVNISGNSGWLPGPFAPQGPRYRGFTVNSPRGPACRRPISDAGINLTSGVW
jgi:hypothetical protein